MSHIARVRGFNPENPLQFLPVALARRAPGMKLGYLVIVEKLELARGMLKVVALPWWWRWCAWENSDSTGMESCTTRC